MIQQAHAVIHGIGLLFLFIFRGSTMITHTKHQMFLRASLRLFFALAFFGGMLLLHSPSVSAQDCDVDAGCPVVRIFNCTWEPIDYDVEFILCCEKRAVVGPKFPVRQATSPDECAETRYVAPRPCTVIGVWNINPPPPFGWFFDITNCTLYIY